MSDVAIIQSNDALECAIIGYLAKKTNLVWQIKVKKEHMDFQIICRFGDVEFATRYIYFEKDEIDKSGLFGVICPYIDEVIVYWERVKENES